MSRNVNFRKAVSILLLFLFLAGVHLFIYAQNITLKYRITDLKIKLAELTSARQALGSRAAREEDLAYVEKIAKSKLGMIYPADITYIVEENQAPKNPPGRPE